jgi:periplasmic divalent cation tolerance protein
MTDKILVLVTCGSRTEARKIARALVGQRLAACVSEIGVSVASTYRWKGKVEAAKEFLLLIKTSKKRFAAVRDAVLKLHSYEVPEIIALPIAAGSRAYLDWIATSVKTTKFAAKPAEQSPKTVERVTADAPLNPFSSTDARFSRAPGPNRR